MVFKNIGREGCAAVIVRMKSATVGNLRFLASKSRSS